ncbi:hypothetical protein FOPG_09907 [Fusarium oxysporum f. sp. conglutinans race 2 54008]|uniref:Uncharacterized protein n=1 Tax=Fusarium oxysporum f. sp. conglutinans race 2 54008 TaxID=1089457 RepID=X0IPV4_FUSOX|nr:hypothetical protein FOPG_09907 [Fusarium oxysporum f. sp. conglutinans race 2 54008]
MVESMELGRNPKYQRTSLLCIRVRVFRFLFKQEQFSSNENQTTPSSSILSFLLSLYTLTLSKLQNVFLRTDFLRRGSELGLRQCPPSKIKRVKGRNASHDQQRQQSTRRSCRRVLSVLG